MAENLNYILVHVTTSGEYLAPLVASQLFDQAENQAVVNGADKPQKVQAWIIGSFREYFDEKSKNKIASLKGRCPHVNIQMINGISRLKGFPMWQQMQSNRKRLGEKNVVIYHCRGANAVEQVAKLKELYPQDRIVLDVRGYWPAELLYNRGIEDQAQATGKDLSECEQAAIYLRRMVSVADGVTTVSNALRQLLIADMSAPKDTIVVPCCVNEIVADDKRNEIRKRWGVADNQIVLVYSGTTAAYQHLQDLTIPFLHKLIGLNNNIKLVFLSPEVDKIKVMLEKEGIDPDSVILENLKQAEVAAALNACDVGILIRKPTLVNRVANPVKIGEYLAAGLPIIIAKNVGGVADELFEQSLLKGISIAVNESMEEESLAVNNWLGGDLTLKRAQVKQYTVNNYLWRSVVHTSRGLYRKILINK